MRLLFRAALAAGAIGFSTPLPAADDQQPAAQATPKPDRAQLEAKFNEVDAKRTATAANTKERSDAATAAMQLASDIAWMVFDAGQYEEAANWFARSGELKNDSIQNARGYW